MHKLTIHITLLITGILFSPAMVNGDSIDHGKIQAAYIYNFINFTTWPNSHPANKNKSVNICLYGEDSITEELNRFNGEKVQGRTINIDTSNSETSLEDCHVLYISPEMFSQYKQLLDLISSRPILSVGNDERLLEAGGIITLTQIEGRHRFNVNMRALRRSNLYLSSKLLALAIIKEE